MEKFYTEGTYLQNNPSWDADDVDWKLEKILPLIRSYFETDKRLRICEIGCGGGGLLSKLADKFPQHTFVGWDISPDAAQFWTDKKDNLSFHVGDIFNSSHEQSFDLILLIDVIEHVENPHSFLSNTQKIAENIFFHVPLDLSAVSVVLDYKLLKARRQVGHIHYFTKSLFLDLLRETSLSAVSVNFSNSWKDSPHKSISTKLLNTFRYVLNFFSPELNARLLGGNTLFVLAKKSD